jgi:hypothetical protein
MAGAGNKATPLWLFVRGRWLRWNGRTWVRDPAGPPGEAKATAPAPPAPAASKQAKHKGGRPSDYLWSEWNKALNLYLKDNPRPDIMERLVEWSQEWFETNDAGVPSDRMIRRYLKPYYD